MGDRDRGQEVTRKNKGGGKLCDSNGKVSKRHYQNQNVNQINDNLLQGLEYNTRVASGE